MINKGIKPVIRLIEEVPVSEWEFAERFWIDYYISLGYQLTNCSPGGESGALGYKHTPEAVEKIRAANLGRKMPDWFPDFISKRDWGKKHTEETRRNMSIAHWGYKATEEAKRNMSIAMKKSWAERRTKAGG